MDQLFTDKPEIPDLPAVGAEQRGKEYGTDIRIQEPVVGGTALLPFAGYDKPTSLPYNMKVLSMQWLGPDNEPMRKFDKFELGKSYFLDLSIGFEGGEELGHVYPKNNRDFKVNGKSVNAWMEYEDSTDGHVWHVYESYKLVDPSAMGTVTGTVESYGDPDETITIQLGKQRKRGAGVYYDRHRQQHRIFSYRR